jgi:hypothetical protein
VTLPARQVLRTAQELVLNGARRDAYGEPVEAMRRVAGVWTATRGCDRTARQVAVELALLKLTREACRHDLDNLVDAAGYVLVAALAAEAEEAEAS